MLFMKKILIVLFVVQSCFAWSQTLDANGKKQGYWKKKDERTNKLIYEGEFKDDKPVGKFRYYYPNDSVRAIMFFSNGGNASYAKLFHMNGKRAAEGKYVNKEMKDSVWTYYDETGILISRETYNKGKKNGKSYVYLPDGSLSEEKSFKDDAQHGTFKQYFDGKVIKGEGNYVNGNLEGRAAYYYPNGVEVAAGYYKNGAKTGVWVYKEEDGKVKEKELYKNGKQASQKETEEFFSKSKQQQTTGEKKPETKNTQQETTKQQGTKK